MLGEILLKLRKESYKTQKEVAKYLTISQQAYANYESNKREPDIETILKLSDYFNVSIEYLLGKSNKKTPADINVNERDKKIIKLLSDLNPNEVQRVQDFVEGLKASRTKNPSQHQ